VAEGISAFQQGGLYLRDRRQLYPDLALSFGVLGSRQFVTLIFGEEPPSSSLIAVSSGPAPMESRMQFLRVPIACASEHFFAVDQVLLVHFPGIM
jgi:hypothetical protein